MKKLLIGVIFCGVISLFFGVSVAKEQSQGESRNICFKFLEFPSPAIQHYNATKGVRQIPSEELMVEVSCEKGR